MGSTSAKSGHLQLIYAENFKIRAEITKSGLQSLIYDRIFKISVAAVKSGLWLFMEK